MRRTSGDTRLDPNSKNRGTRYLILGNRYCVPLLLIPLLLIRRPVFGSLCATGCACAGSIVRRRTLPKATGPKGSWKNSCPQVPPLCSNRTKTGLISTDALWRMFSTSKESRTRAQSSRTARILIRICLTKATPSGWGNNEKTAPGKKSFLTIGA